MVGAGGYASTYFTTMWDCMNDDSYFKDYDLCAVVDPFAAQSSVYQALLDRNIPVYDTLEQFYSENKADLVLIVSPVQFHKEQILTAFANGSHVMCEKPLTVFAEDVAELENEAQKYGLMLGVGFQWSFSRRVLALKKDILSGRFGKAKRIRTFISWMRGDNYYNSWHGHLYTSKGELLMDSVISNAMAHYLHFGLFVLGPSMTEALLPESIKASLYRTKNIQSFDTCSVQCHWADGLTHNLYLTHGGDHYSKLNIEIEFEKATACINPQDEHLLVTLEDGTMLDYDELASERHITGEKIDTMLRLIASGKTDVPCTPATTLPFALVCNSLFAEVPITDFPKDKFVQLDNGTQDISYPGQYVPGLYEQLQECYNQDKTPYEMGYDWAVPDKEYTLKSPAEYAAILKEKLL